MTFRLGQKVIAIAGSSPGAVNPPRDATIPVVGKVYTVREIFSYTDRCLITVYECDNRHLINKYDYSGLEPGFCATRFRPVVEGGSDISVFTEILRSAKPPAKVKALAVAPHDGKATP